MTTTSESAPRGLESHPLLRGLTREQLAALAACSHEESFDTGGLVFREGADATQLHLLTSGTVTLQTYVPGRGTLNVETLHAGDILGVHWLFPPRQWALSGIASEPVVTIAIDATCLLGTLDADPALGYAVMRRLVGHLYARLNRVRLQRLDVYRSSP